MKKIIVTVAVLLIGLHGFSQKEKIVAKSSFTGCPERTTLRISPAAISLLESYRNLFVSTAGNCTSSRGVLTAFGKMDGRYYNIGHAGWVSFASSYKGVDTFRTIWSRRPASYTYYGFCVPPDISWPDSAVGENHVWELKFVPVKNYAAATIKNYRGVTGVPVSKIRSVDCIKLEEENGYCAATEPLLYNNVRSSKGIVATLTLTDGTKLMCYVINNYDATGTLRWKE